MSFDYSTLITNRARSDSDTLKTLLSKPMAEWTAEERTAFNGAVMRGSYDYTDLNRVNACLDDLAARLSRVGCNVPGYERLKIPRTAHPSGRLPEGYTELEYIQSTGTQYIDTGFKPKNTTKITADFQVTTQPTSHLIIFGCRTGYSSADQFVLGFAGHKSPAVWRADFGSGQTSFPSTVVWSSRFTAVFDSSACTLNADSVNNTNSTFTSTHDLFLLTDNDNETAAGYISAKLYACRIYDNGTLARNFIPCKNAAGMIGLYDTVGAEFYPNAGTGSFTAGAAVTWPEDPEEPDTDLDPYTWYESDVPTVPLMARYRANVAAVRGALTLPEGTPGVPETMRRLTPAAANSIEAVLLALDVILNNLPAAVRHCGVTTCGSKGVIA